VKQKNRPSTAAVVKASRVDTAQVPGRICAIDAEFALKAADAAGATPSFELVAYTGRAIRQAWSRNPLVVDLSGMDNSRQSIPILWGHDASIDSVLGQSTSITNDGQQLILAGELIGEGETAQKVIALAKRGMRFQASIGADTSRIENVAPGQSVTVNGREFSGPISVVRGSALRETSIVLMGADAQTSAAIAAEATEDFDMAHDANLSPTEKVEAAATGAVEKPINTNIVQAKGGDGAAADDHSPGATEVLKAELKAEREAREALAKRMELAELRMSRGGVGIHVSQPEVDSGKVVEAALALQSGLPNVEKAYDARVLEAADKVKRDVSIGQVLLKAAKANSYTGSDRLSSGNLGPVLQAAFATHDISNLLAALVNKFLLAGFMSVEDSWKQVANVRSVSDFKNINLLRLNGSFKFQKVGNAGELKVAQGSDSKRSIAADTWGIQTSLTRQDIVNDDANALSQIPQRIGRGAALSLNEAIWAEFEADNATYFQKATAASGNALSLSSLKVAATAWRRLKDPDGNPLGIVPRVLLVPPELELTAAELMTSALLISGNTTAAPNANVLQGRYKVVTSAYLTSSSTWWLMADSMDLPSLDVVFLNGQQVPTIEQVQADYSLLGVAMRGYMDFGVAKAESLAAYRMATA